jgi:hypothetical protein
LRAGEEREKAAVRKLHFWSFYRAFLKNSKKSQF